jgi:tetratricopeptide (TPR) repeat protein
MATKTITSETSASGSVPSVEQTFSAGLEHLNGGRLIEASTAFKYVLAQAVEQDRLGLGRTARGYLAAIDARLREQDKAAEQTPEMTAQLLLNQKQAEAALPGLDQALLAQPERATLHYLKAVAHAQLEQGQESADALAKAVELEPDYLFQFRLEPDFDALRHSGAFAALIRS